jgi:two-component system, NarL family, sensor kinase
VSAERSEPERTGGVRALAALRLALLPLLLVGGRVVAHPLAGTRSFDLALAASAAYGAAALADALRAGGPRVAGTPLVACDLAFVALLAFTSGRAFADLRVAFMLPPVGAALLLGPRRTAVVSGAAVLAYLAVAFAHPASAAQPAALTLAQALWLIWIGAAGVVLCDLLRRRGSRIGQLVGSQRALVAQALGAEQRARRRISEALHDSALQDLCTARQDLADVRHGRPEALASAEVALQRALDGVRAAVAEASPHPAAELDLASALRSIADQQARRGGFDVELRIDADAGGAPDPLLAALARELLVNVARHARATVVTVELARAGAGLRLVVADDGRGFTREQEAAALRAGHIGLAAARERAAAAGGTLEVDSRPGAGTTVRCLLGVPVAVAGPEPTAVPVARRPPKRHNSVPVRPGRAIRVDTGRRDRVWTW